MSSAKDSRNISRHAASFKSRTRVDVDKKTLRLHERSIQQKKQRDARVNLQRQCNTSISDEISNDMPNEDVKINKKDKVEMRQAMLKQWKEKRALEKRLKAEQSGVAFGSRIAPPVHNTVQVDKKVGRPAKATKAVTVHQAVPACCRETRASARRREETVAATVAKKNAIKPSIVKTTAKPAVSRLTTTKAATTTTTTKCVTGKVTKVASEKVVPARMMNTRSTNVKTATAKTTVAKTATTKPTAVKTVPRKSALASKPVDIAMTTRRDAKKASVSFAPADFQFSAPETVESFTFSLPASPRSHAMFVKHDLELTPSALRRCSSTPVAAKHNMADASPLMSVIRETVEPSIGKSTEPSNASDPRTATPVGAAPVLKLTSILSSDDEKEKVMGNAAGQTYIVPAVPPTDQNSSEPSEPSAFATPGSAPRRSKRIRASTPMSTSQSGRKVRGVRSSLALRHLSPEDRVEALMKSPMVEMTRRTPRGNRKSTVPVIDFDDDDEVEANSIQKPTVSENSSTTDVPVVTREMLLAAGETAAIVIEPILAEKFTAQLPSERNNETLAERSESTDEKIALLSVSDEMADVMQKKGDLVEEEEEEEPVVEEVEPIREEAKPIEEDPEAEPIVEEPVVEKEAELIVHKEESVLEKAYPIVEEEQLVEEDVSIVAKKAEPIVDETEPIVDESEPIVDESEPIVEKKEMVVEETGPIVEETEPIVEKEEPFVEQREPVVEKTEPVMEQTELIVEKEEPVVEETKPIVEESELVVEKEEMVVEETWLIVEETEPILEKEELVVDQTEPLVEESEPIVEKEPVMEKTEPIGEEQVLEVEPVVEKKAEPIVEEEEEEPVLERMDTDVKEAESIHDDVSASGPTLMTEEHDVAYFRKLLSSETSRLRELCEKWNAIGSGTVLSEEVSGQLRSTIGQAELLMRQRFKQFSGLVDNCELGDGEKETLCSDLQGFWEMIYFQVEDVNAKFAQLDTLQSNGWKSPQQQVPKKNKVVKRKAPVKSGRPKPSAGTSKFAEFRAKMKQQKKMAIESNVIVEEEEEEAAVEKKKTFDAGFFRIDSPVYDAEKAQNDMKSGRGSMPTTPGCSPMLRSVLSRRSLARSSPRGVKHKGTPLNEVVANKRRRSRLSQLAAGDENGDIIGVQKELAAIEPQAECGDSGFDMSRLLVPSVRPSETTSCLSVCFAATPEMMEVDAPSSPVQDTDTDMAVQSKRALRSEFDRQSLSAAKRTPSNGGAASGRRRSVRRSVRFSALVSDDEDSGCVRLPVTPRNKNVSYNDEDGTDTPAKRFAKLRVTPRTPLIEANNSTDLSMVPYTPTQPMISPVKMAPLTEEDVNAVESPVVDLMSFSPLSQITKIQVEEDDQPIVRRSRRSRVSLL